MPVTCKKCGKDCGPHSCFTEIYDPQTSALKIVLLCSSCQTKLYKRTMKWLEGKKNE